MQAQILPLKEALEKRLKQDLQDASSDEDGTGYKPAKTPHNKSDDAQYKALYFKKVKEMENIQAS